jgi:uncharacterized protein (TIGR04222 family)
MNPLDFTGPDFLLFYAFYGAIVCVALHWLRHLTEPFEPRRAVPTDPETVAYLRGGPTEAIRVAILTLLERGVLSVEGNRIEVSNRVKLSHQASALERAVFEHYKGNGSGSSLVKPESLVDAAAAYAEPRLQVAGLLPDRAVHATRKRRLTFALAALLGLAALKVAVALSRGHTNVELLIEFAAGFSVFAFALTCRTLTPAGERALKYLTRTFRSTRARVRTGRHAAVEDVAMVAAVFGFTALAGLPHARVHDLCAKQGGNSCAGGCGGGCGDGCGGCGGCGG